MDYLHNNNVNVLQNESRHLFLVTATEVLFFLRGRKQEEGKDTKYPCLWLAFRPGQTSAINPISVVCRLFRINIYIYMCGVDKVIGKHSDSWTLGHSRCVAIWLPSPVCPCTSRCAIHLYGTTIELNYTHAHKFAGIRRMWIQGGIGMVLRDGLLWVGLATVDATAQIGCNEM